MNTRQAASYLGIAPKTLYKWKQQAKANEGFLILNGAAVPFQYGQTGTLGQGRLFFERDWLDQLKSAMERRPTVRRPRTVRRQHQNITTKLGRPPE